MILGYHNRGDWWNMSTSRTSQVENTITLIMFKIYQKKWDIQQTLIFRPWKMSGTEPCLFGRKSRSKLFQGGDGWFSCGCRFQGRAPWFLHAPTWLELFTFLSGPFPPIFSLFQGVYFLPTWKKHTHVKWVEHFPIQITFISLTSASAQVYCTTKVKNTTCQSQ